MMEESEFIEICRGTNPFDDDGDSRPSHMHENDGSQRGGSETDEDIYIYT